MTREWAMYIWVGDIWGRPLQLHFLNKKKKISKKCESNKNNYISEYVSFIKERCQYLCTIWLNFWSQSKIHKSLEKVKYMLLWEGWMVRLLCVGSETHYMMVTRTAQTELWGILWHHCFKKTSNMATFTQCWMILN